MTGIEFKLQQWSVHNHCVTTILSLRALNISLLYMAQLPLPSYYFYIWKDRPMGLNINALLLSLMADTPKATKSVPAWVAIALEIPLPIALLLSLANFHWALRNGPCQWFIASGQLMIRCSCCNKSRLIYLALCKLFHPIYAVEIETVLANGHN